MRARPRRSFSSRLATGNRAEATESAMEVTGLKSMSSWKGHGEAESAAEEAGHRLRWRTGGQAEGKRALEWWLALGTRGMGRWRRPDCLKAFPALRRPAPFP